MSQPAVNQPRRGATRSFAGMVGAMGAVLGLIACMWALSWFQHADPPNPVPTVRYGAALAAARSQAPFHVLAPDPVPAGLRATSVSYDGVGPINSWQLGFLTPDKQFIGLFQGNGLARIFIAANTPATDPGSPVTLDGTQWKTLTNTARGETALVRTAGGVTVVVTGTADEGQLAAFAESLR